MFWKSNQFVSITERTWVLFIILTLQPSFPFNMSRNSIGKWQGVPCITCQWACFVWVPTDPIVVSTSRKTACLLSLMRAVWPVIYRKGSFPVCASDRQSCTSRADDQRQILEAKHGPLSGSEFLASRVFSGSALSCRSFWESFPTKSFLFGFYFPRSPPCHYFCPFIFSCSLNRDIIETGVGRELFGATE